MRSHLATLVDEWRGARGDTAVVAHRGNRALRTGYTELAELAGRFSADLRLRGVGCGDRVVLWGENSAEWIAAFFGCALCGALAVPLDAAGTTEFAERVIAEVAPRLVVGDPGALARLDPLRMGVLAGPPVCLSLPEMRSWMPREPDFRVDPAVGLETPVQIVFTSGTTSEPKGVVHTHRNILASVGPIEREIGKSKRFLGPFRPLRFLHTLPLSHVFGQFVGMWLPPLLRAEVHLVDTLEPARLAGLIRRERVSVLVAVPRILELLRAHLEGRFPGLAASVAASAGKAGGAGVPAWKRWWRFRAVHRALGFKFWALICGGATLPVELEGFWNGLGLALIQGYGMTETAALVTLNHPFRAEKGTLGKTLPGREVRLSAEGEIQVRGDVLAAGSWRSGQFQPRTEEWLATGDLGFQDASGALRFAGRKGEAIVTGAGLNVHPQDLEAALLAQPGVRGCAVVGCDTPRGPEPVGVVLFRGDDAALGAVREGANARLAAFQQMHNVLRWPEPQMPYTSTGKLLRRQVAAWACAEIVATREGFAGAGSGADRLLALIGEITREPVRDGSGEQRLTEDLHLDSLGRVQLQSALGERFGVEIGDAEMASIGTLASLRRRLGAPQNGQSVGTGGDSGVLPPVSQGERGAAVRYARWPWSAPVRWLRAMFTEAMLRPLVWALARPRVEMDAVSGTACGRVSGRVRGTASGLSSGPVLFVANHVNLFDLPLLLYGLPRERRGWLATAMSAEVLADLRAGRGQGSRWRNLCARAGYWLLLGLFNVFPLPRLSGFRRSFAHAGEALDRGYSVLVFPEGRRSGTGRLQPFRPGIGLLVRASGVPVVPLALAGVGSEAREDGRWFRAGGVVIRFGTPLRFGGSESPEEITALLQNAVGNLCRS